VLMPKNNFHGMPRHARLDAPGALHHVMTRGIERRTIFRGDVDREDFLERMGCLLPETRTVCYAWAFLPDHAHFLLRSCPHHGIQASLAAGVETPVVRVAGVRATGRAPLA
jgi:REP element-mobilizing transposase RayT